MVSMRPLYSLFRISVLFLFFSKTQGQETLNQVQLIGSHNSYKSGIDQPVLDTLQKINPKWAKTLAYGHISLSEQLDLGLRNLEIDVSVDRQGRKYNEPYYYQMFKHQVKPYDEAGEMQQSGLKVFHIQDIDYRTHCYTLRNCLRQLNDWSVKNHGHTPVFVTMNAKDSSNPLLPTKADKFEKQDFEEWDKAILEELGREKLLIPADVKGKYKSINEAIIRQGWPKLDDARGKFIFVLDETGTKRVDYLASASPIKGMFTNSPEGEADAAVMIINDPLRSFDKIKELVKKGYIVRTRADADTFEARNNDNSKFEAAKNSGAQIITTDYYLKSNYFNSEYKVIFPDGGYFRKNPLF